MKIIDSNNLDKTKIIECPKGGFTSHRILLDSDNMGFSLTRTVIKPNGKQHWHYKNHLESCYCVSGKGVLTEIESPTNDEHIIKPGVTYVLDKNDDHLFEALEETVLICVFNPPLKGDEVHQEDGSYD
jgi:L-ectoine synthase